MYITDDGIRLNASLEMPGEKREKYPLVIILHGFTGHMEERHIVAMADMLRGIGCATLRADLYGHGHSGGKFHDHTLFKWMTNAMTLIDYARGLDFVTDIYLSGHSQGGLVAALAAGLEADRIRGLILRAPAFMIPDCARKGDMLGARFDPADIPDDLPVIKGLTLDGNYLRVAQGIRPEEAIDRFPGPVLILHGDRDDVVPAEDSVKAAARYARCTLVILPGETHHFDHDPERMKRVVRDWLRAERGGAREEG